MFRFIANYSLIGSGIFSHPAGTPYTFLQRQYVRRFSPGSKSSWSLAVQPQLGDWQD
jgi:hypothetical protein